MRAAFPESRLAELHQELRAAIAGRGDSAAIDPASIDPVVAKALDSYLHFQSLAQVAFGVAALSLALGGLTFAQRRIRPDFRARERIERAPHWLMIAASVVAILTTIGIVLSLLIRILEVLRQGAGDGISLRSPLVAADRPTVGSGGGLRQLWRHSAFRRNRLDHPDRHGDGRTHRSLFGDLPFGVCQSQDTQLGKAGSGDSSRHSDRGLRFLCRPNGRAGDSWLGHPASGSTWRRNRRSPPAWSWAS